MLQIDPLLPSDHSLESVQAWSITCKRCEGRGTVYRFPNLRRSVCRDCDGEGVRLTDGLTEWKQKAK